MAIVLSQASINKTKSTERSTVVGKSIFCLVQEGNLVRSSCNKAVDKTDKNAIAGKCNHCHKDVYFIPGKFAEVLKIACSIDCEKALKWQTSHDIQLAAEIENERKKKLEDLEFGFIYDEYGGIVDKRPDFCPSCNGAKNQTSYDHTVDCPNSLENKLKAKEALRNSTCSVCGGARSMNGYKHTPECPESSVNKTKAKLAVKTFCPKCNGPSRGSGFSHTAECPDFARNKMKAKYQQIKAEKLGAQSIQEVCPKCGGSRRGRGFSHKDDCSAKKEKNA